jgi:hypothetical protein
MTSIIKDRNYYRAMNLKELREQAKYGINVNWTELAIALTERLDTIRREVYDEVAS